MGDTWSKCEDLMPKKPQHRLPTGNTGTVQLLTYMMAGHSTATNNQIKPTTAEPSATLSPRSEVREEAKFTKAALRRLLV